MNRVFADSYFFFAMLNTATPVTPGRSSSAGVIADRW